MFGGDYGRKEGKVPNWLRNRIETEWNIQVGSRRPPGSEDHFPPFDIVNPGRGNPHLND